MGYRWVVQRHGELKLGLWRKQFRKKTLRKPFSKRFVFVPGFGDTPLSWLGVLTLIEPVLRSNYDEVVLVDFPGYNGRLAAETLCPSVDSIADSLFDVLDSLKPHTVVGHSLGGFLTAHYAAACSTGQRVTGKAQHYADLKSAIVIDPSGYFETESERTEWLHKMDRLANEGAKYWRPFIFDREPIWFRMLGEQFLGFLNRDEVEVFLRSMRPDHEIKPVLPGIRTRMSVVWGERDSLLPSSLAQGWVANLKNTAQPAQAVIIRGVGHSPQVESPTKTAAVLAQLLSNREPHAIGRSWYRLLKSAE